MATMRTNSRQQLDLISELDPTYLDSLIREDFERCHPGETLEDLQRRASFSKEDRGLLRDWMAVAAVRAAAACKAKALPPHPTITSEVSADLSPIVQARWKDRSLTAILNQPRELPVSSSCDTTVASCADAKSFPIRTLPRTPCDFQSPALALVT
jgi:hypothetical protein